MISFVVPVYRAAASLPELHRRLVAEFGTAPTGFKLNFVEDCGGNQLGASTYCGQGFSRYANG